MCLSGCVLESESKVEVMALLAGVMAILGSSPSSRAML